jgi:serine phosphatase RsbU (regulator of sigma subunit)
MRVRRIIYLGGAFLLVLLKFTIDVVGKTVGFGGLATSIARELMVAGTFVLLYLLFLPSLGRRETTPVRRIGLVLILTTVVGLFVVLVSVLSLVSFDTKASQLTPLDYATLFTSSVTSLVVGLYAVLTYIILRSFLVTSPRRGMQRNVIIFSLLAIASSAATVSLRPLEVSVVARVFFWLAILMAIVNSFRLPWIIELTKREKIFSLIYTFFLFVFLTGLNVLVNQNESITRAVLFYSYPLSQFVSLMIFFANIYFGMAFVSTLFHLPTAEAFDRKRTEVTSLHTLSRLVNQVFDFNELVETVTTMTLGVCEAKSCWLEILEGGAAAQTAGGGPVQMQLAGMKNIGRAEIDRLIGPGRGAVRDEALSTLKPIVVDDLQQDARFRHLGKARPGIGSMVVVPLVSHNGPIGLLYATKEAEYGFVKDDVDVISAFADQATVAVENSRLIKESIERERLLKEMMLAQEMQRKLLPQSVPRFSTFDIDAMTAPAFEVGGDYYDFMQLDPHRVGIVVGDVSGKGVSAAFYMSEVKGIFLALGRMYTSPKEFMVKANEALATSIDKHSFVSLIYAVLDIRTGELKLARAGHCPMLLMAAGGVQYIRPNGLGLGLTELALFGDVIEEHTLRLEVGDVCVLYTDGLTEARNGADDEFGYDRLLAVAQGQKHRSAAEIKDEIIRSVREFVGGPEASHDDLTLVVVKWTGSGPHQKADPAS